MPTFPSLRDARKQRDAIIYSDAACTVTCSASRVYFRANDGGIHTLYPTSPTTIPTVTGSRGANAALASLLTALAAQGIIVDSSS